MEPHFVLISTRISSPLEIVTVTQLAISTMRSIPQKFRAWLVCLSGALFFFYEFLQMQMFSAINQPLRATFDVGATQLGALSSSFLWGDLLWLVPAGIILDHFSVRRVTLMAMATCLISTAGFACANSVLVAALWHGLTGAANAFCFLSCVLLVSKWFPSHRQAQAMGWVVTIAFVGGMMAQTPLTRLTAMLGWRQALWWDVCLGLLILSLMWLLLEDHPQQDHPTMSKMTLSSVWQDLKQVFWNTQNHYAGWYIALLNLPIMVLCALWGASLLVTLYGLDTLTASEVVSMILIGSILGCPMVGYWSDRSETRCLPMLSGALVSLFCISVLMLGTSLSVWQLSMLFFALGFATSTQIIGYPLITESNPPQLTATANSFASLMVMGAAALGQVIFGWLLDWHWQGAMVAHQRLYTAADYGFAMWLFPATFVLATATVLLARDTHCQPLYQESDYHG